MPLYLFKDLIFLLFMAKNNAVSIKNTVQTVAQNKREADFRKINFTFCQRQIVLYTLRANLSWQVCIDLIFKDLLDLFQSKKLEWIKTI